MRKFLGFPSFAGVSITGRQANPGPGDEGAGGRGDIRLEKAFVYHTAAAQGHADKAAGGRVYHW